MKHLKSHVCRPLVCILLALSLLLLTACNPVPEGANISSEAAEASGTASTADDAAADAGTDSDTTDPAAADSSLEADSNPEEAADNSADTIHFIKLDTDITSDSFLIMSQGVTMLVDTSNPDPTTKGNYSVAVNTENVKAVVDYLSSLGIRHLDYVVMTHNHSDHIGGITTLCNLHFIDADTVVYSRTGKETQEDIDTPEWQNQYYYQLAVDALDGVGAEFHSLLEEQVTDLTVKVGNFDVKFMNLDLDGDGNVDFDDQNENNNSLVLKVTKGSIDTLLTADIETEQEYALLDAYDLSDIEVLKAPHHGSTTSSSYEFLKEMQPETVIVTSFRYRQGGAHKYLRDILRARIFTTKDCTADAIVETVYNDRYSIDNGVLFEDTGGQDGWLSWFDYFMYMEDGIAVSDTWKKISGSWYHFNEDGLMDTGAVTIDGKDYYFGDDGKMQTGLINVDGKLRFYSPWNGAATLPGMPWFGGRGNPAPGPSPAPSSADTAAPSQAPNPPPAPGDNAQSAETP